MNLDLYHFIHVGAVLLLTGFTFYAFANPAPESRKRIMIITGVCSLLVLITGFGMWGRMYQMHAHTWIIVKIICWLGLSALAGMAYRRREKAGLYASIAVVLLLVAVAMVYFKP